VDAAGLDLSLCSFTSKGCSVLTLPFYIHGKEFSLKQLETAAKRLEWKDKINIKLEHTINKILWGMKSN
jgi:hypothetical protein